MDYQKAVYLVKTSDRFRKAPKRKLTNVSEPYWATPLLVIMKN